jgi:Flp pilus assembly pilin Flp
VKAGNDAAIRDLRQAANVEDEIGATSVDFDLIAGLLNIAIGEAESLE